jgi:beta-glucosidase
MGMKHVCVTVRRTALTLAMGVLVGACASETAPFPRGFKWGTATAPVQVEGGLHASDWYQWESTPANATGAHADDGPDEYDYFDADFALAEGLHNNAARLGIDWSRLFPTAASFPGAPDAAAVAHYHAVFASLRAHGLHPMVTLYHWSFPTYIDDLQHQDTVRGWLDEGVVRQFAAFATWAATEYGGEVDDWITLNEPTNTILQGFVTGKYPPERTFADTGGIANAETAARNMIYAHAAAYDALHAADTIDADGDGQAARVSCAFHQRVWEPNDPKSAEDVAATDRVHYLSNLIWLNAMVRGDLDADFDQKLDGPNDRTGDPALAHRLDFIGVNYYGPARVLALGSSSIGPLTGLPMLTGLDDDRPHTEYGWSIDPAGFRVVLDELRPFGLPLEVTENGIADAGDAQRPRFIAEHLQVLERAIADGLDVRGYYHWSLIDNFEWAGGYCPRFGLFHVDFAAPQKTRTAGAGARAYQKIIQDRRADPSPYPPYPAPAQLCPGGG